jgi:hypothetical protein
MNAIYLYSKRGSLFLFWVLSAMLAFSENLHADNLIPRDSPLRKEVKMDIGDTQIRSEILKLIPIGTAEAQAKELFKKHMPSKERAKHSLDSAHIPEVLKHKKYTCFRLFESVSWLNLGTQWLEVLFFFDGGVLKDVWVGRAAVSP